MSIALALEDEQVTLEEALAFIERCESSDDTFESLASSDHSSPDVDPLVFSPCLTTSPSSSETSGWCRSETSKYTSDGSKREDCVAENPSQQAQRRDPKKRKNKARTTPKIRTRKHSKTEILTLREQVLHLTARLAQLQLYKQVPSRLSQVDENMHDDAASESPARNTSLLVANANLRNGAQIADLELQKLERSKTLNRKLKDAFERQMKLSNTLQKVFEKQIVAHSDLDLLVDLESQTKICRDDSSIFTELHRYLDKLYYTLGEITAPINLRNTSYVFSNNHVYQDPVRGQVLEYVTNTPLRASLQRLDRCLWSHMGACGVTTRPPQPGSAGTINMEKRYKTSFSCDFGEISVSIKSALRKIEEPDRIVVLYTSILVPLGTGLTFRENGYLMVSNATRSALDSSSSPPTTLFQTFYQLFAETPGLKDSVSDERTTYLHDFIQRAHSEKMYAHQLKMQSMLQHELAAIEAEIDRFGSSSLIQCPA